MHLTVDAVNENSAAEKTTEGPNLQTASRLAVSLAEQDDTFPK